MMISKTEYDELVILSRETEMYKAKAERLEEQNRVLCQQVSDFAKKLRIANGMLDEAIGKLNDANSQLKHLNLIKQSMELRRGVGAGL